jgi:hypothetical protein
VGILGNIFSRPHIEIVTFEPDERAILFHSERPLEPGDHKVLATVGELKLKCRVRLETTEADLHFGTFLEPAEALEPLSVLLPRPKVQEDKRTHERIDRILRVCSAAIPRFQATSLDLSLSGVKLKTEGPMPVGEYFELEIQFDDATMAHLSLTGCVRWCREVEQAWQAGVEFIDTPRDTRSRLAYFIKALTAVERGVWTGSWEVFG